MGADAIGTRPLLRKITPYCVLILAVDKGITKCFHQYHNQIMQRGFIFVRFYT